MSAPNISDRLPRYTQYDPMVSVWCATPNTPRTIHRFFDSSPFSPSGQYLVSTQVPYEDRMPVAGDVARIVVTDLTTGEEKIVAETRAWDTQVGAHAQWGADDRQLFFNDLDTTQWQPFGVKLDFSSGERTTFEGGVYHVTRDGRFSFAPFLTRMGLVQAGYGVVVPPQFLPDAAGLADRDGVFVTDLASGQRRLLVSMRTLVEMLRFDRGPCGNEAGHLVGFHLSANRQADRILFILRWVRIPSAREAAVNAVWRRVVRGSRIAGKLLHWPWLRSRLRLRQMVYNTLIVVNSDGTNPRVVLSAPEWAKGGHHPNWCPDGRSLLMNLNTDGRLRFVRFYPDEDRREVLTTQVTGSGHPTLYPDERHIVADAYPRDPEAYGDKTAPIRLVDWKAGTEKRIVRIESRPRVSGPAFAFRVDLHPAWDRSYTRIAFNGNAGGTRRVYVADVRELGLQGS